VNKKLCLGAGRKNDRKQNQEKQPNPDPSVFHRDPHLIS